MKTIMVVSGGNYDGLTRRAANVLSRFVDESEAEWHRGLRNACKGRDALLSAVQSGKVNRNELFKLRGYGKVIHADVCRWLDVEMPPIKPGYICPHCQKLLGATLNDLHVSVTRV